MLTLILILVVHAYAPHPYVVERIVAPRVLLVRTRFCSAVVMTRADRRVPQCREV